MFSPAGQPALGVYDMKLKHLAVALAIVGFSSGAMANNVNNLILVTGDTAYFGALHTDNLPFTDTFDFTNVLGPVFVLATIQVATAIITEATLSFLGVGAPPTSPSLGTLIRVGNDYLFSGEWWITVFPGMMLVIIALSVNLLGDWLRDATNPRLR
jgi:ABC-type dipeptide/oligopeptide/nickel transport system permease subunit